MFAPMRLPTEANVIALTKLGAPVELCENQHGLRVSRSDGSYRR
jgi:hypothetical protein